MPVFLPKVVVDDDTGFVYVLWATLEQILLSVSTDGGRSFSQPKVVVENTEGTIDSVNFLLGAEGKLYCLWIPSIRTPISPDELCSTCLNISASHDGGESWSAPKCLAKLYFRCRPFPYQLHDGLLAFPAPSAAVNRKTGTIYISFASAAPDGTDDAEVFFMALDPDLNVVVPAKRVNDDTTHNDQFLPAIAVSPAGEIGILFYDRRLDQENRLLDVFFARSNDEGKTFFNERVTKSSFPVPPVVDQPTRSGHYDDFCAPGYLGFYIALAADAQFFYAAWADGRNIVRTPRYPDGRHDLDVYFAKIPTWLKE